MRAGRIPGLLDFMATLAGLGYFIGFIIFVDANLRDYKGQLNRMTK